MQDVELGGDRTVTFYVPGTSAGAAAEWSLITAPYNMTVTAVKWMPNAAVTANGTNYATLSLRNRSTTGSGSVVPATRSYAATNSTALVGEAMTLSTTSTDLQPAAGDVLTLAIAHSGTGLTIPAGAVQVTWRGR